MVDRSVPMRVEESNQCESPISIARERSSYSKRFMKLLQDFHHFIQKLDFLVFHIISRVILVTHSTGLLARIAFSVWGLITTAKLKSVVVVCLLCVRTF